ncbi:unnamed protein product [Nippostrongylus brasiliensis]|uniref:Palmitoyltransferase ZDHHC6 (inferred by orthology to a human protein) n=1 Tax=Nippostrongylus brasiliensis TaxID=27835 RepID=A0A0N4YNS1_NIPBR|nr:unnamed protein product [Nippostrongylus brasiliensis]
MVIASALAFGVVVGVGGLLYIQLKYIKNNKTGIEEYIEQKAVSYREEEDCDWEDFTYPYDLGWKRNFREVLFSWSGEVGKEILVSQIVQGALGDLRRSDKYIVVAEELIV